LHVPVLHTTLLLEQKPGYHDPGLL